MKFISKKSKIKLQSKIKFRNKWLYIRNVAIGATIFFICTISAIPTSAVLYVASFHIFGYEAMSQITSKLPEFMQFIEVGGMEPEINFGFYFAMACTIIAAILICWALYRMDENSEKRGENNCKLIILDSFNQEKDQKISYNPFGIGKGTPTDPIFVTLQKKYPGGCEVRSNDGKIVTLKYKVKGQNGGYEYEVVKYQNNQNKKITKENSLEKFLKDFFGEEENARNGVTVYSLDLFTLSTLSNVVLETNKKQPKDRTRSPASK